MEFCIHILLKVQGNDLISFHPSSSLIVHPHFSKLDKVQTNDLAPTSLCPSPLPFMYPHLSKLDEATRTLHARLEYEIKVGEAKWEYVHIGNYQKCLGKANRKCCEEFGAEISENCSNCLIECLKYGRKMGHCFLRCYRSRASPASCIVRIKVLIKFIYSH
jgi:hypothetical protein